jgi:hypothetical protein
MLESRAVKLTLQTQLLPDGDQAKKLSAPDTVQEKATRSQR